MLEKSLPGIAHDIVWVTVLREHIDEEFAQQCSVAVVRTTEVAHRLDLCSHFQLVGSIYCDRSLRFLRVADRVFLFVAGQIVHFLDCPMKRKAKVLSVQLIRSK